MTGWKAWSGCVGLWLVACGPVSGGVSASSGGLGGEAGAPAPVVESPSSPGTGTSPPPAEPPPPASEPELPPPASEWERPPVWTPEGTLCGPSFACRAWVMKGSVCSEAHAPVATACSVSSALPAGQCNASGACVLPPTPDVDWRFRPDLARWSVVGRAAGSGVLLAEMTSSDDWGFEGPYSECRITRFDPSRPDREGVLHAGAAPCNPWVLHGLHAVGSRWSPEKDRYVWSLLMLDGSQPLRDFDLDTLLVERWRDEGVRPAYTPLQWLQGTSGQLLLVQTLQSGDTWVASLDLGRLAFAWTHSLPGVPSLHPIADEQGRLFLSLQQGEARRAVGLASSGAELWSVETGGAPLAVFQGTLFLDDGAVRSTEDGRGLYHWPASPGASVQLTGTHAAVLAPCEAEACSRVTLLRRDSGTLLTQALIPDAPWGTRTTALLTADGTVAVLRHAAYPDLMTSSDAPVYGARQYLVREGEPPRLLLERLSPTDESLERSFLLDGQWLGLEREGTHDSETPGAELVGLWRSTPLKTPAHGWLALEGNLAGGHAPE